MKLSAYTFSLNIIIVRLSDSIFLMSTYVLYRVSMTIQFEKISFQQNLGISNIKGQTHVSEKIILNPIAMET